MSFFNKMERKYGRYAIPNLMNYIVGLYILGMAFQWFAPDFYYQYLSLNAQAILKGQVWRIVTFIIRPPFYDPLSNALMIYLYYSLGRTLEMVWGAFKFNVYFFMGMAGHVIAAIVIYLGFHQIWLLDTQYLNMSLFFAFAMTFPNLQFLLFFVVPIKAKWMALIYGVDAIYGLVMGNGAARCAIALSLLNFAVFYLMTGKLNKVNPREIKRKHQFQSQVKMKPQGQTHHKCAVCGRTEKDGDDLEFRYCSKCAGNYEYCQDHLYTHKHVTAEENGKK
ncbi:rhomboid family intramembrane serine protease [Lachnoclostridium edouardi]|uniref:rhomboid family intramembrane serine protease n=1 Tax=Lachnoclostridium edouardi TaxID=1926283 RepID=UPI000C7C5572|nr:hypothetical protein [Lachnoclostridium edouardi]